MNQTTVWHPWSFVQRIILSVLLVGMAVGAPYASGHAAAAAPSDPSASERYTIETFQEVLRLLEEKHISRPDRSALLEGAIEGMLAQLNDPYTDVYTSDSWSRLERTLEENEYIGIGMRTRFMNTAFLIEQVYNDTPAARAGLRPGQSITAINGKKVQSPEALAVMRNQLGVTVTLTVRTPGTSGTSDVVIVNARYRIPTVDVVMTPDRIGYIKLYSFSKTAATEVAQAMDLLRQVARSPIAWILDLRDNPGGYLSVAQQLLSLFMPAGVYMNTVDRAGQRQAHTIPNGRTVAEPVVVLVNEQSASASEIVAGALQDERRATLIGATTQGKGSMQTIEKLSQGGGIKITEQYYETPKGHPVNKVGIKPDIEARTLVRQTLLALRQLGQRSFRMETGVRTVSLNGIALPMTIPSFVENGKKYVAIAPLAEFLEATVKWEVAVSRLKLIRGQKTMELTVENGLRVRDGMSFVARDQLQRMLTNVRIAGTDEVLTMEWSTP